MENSIILLATLNMYKRQDCFDRVHDKFRRTAQDVWMVSSTKTQSNWRRIMQDTSNNASYATDRRPTRDVGPA